MSRSVLLLSPEPGGMDHHKDVKASVSSGYYSSSVFNLSLWKQFQSVCMADTTLGTVT